MQAVVHFETDIPDLPVGGSQCGTNFFGSAGKFVVDDQGNLFIPLKLCDPDRRGHGLLMQVKTCNVPVKKRLDDRLRVKRIGCFISFAAVDSHGKTGEFGENLVAIGAAVVCIGSKKNFIVVPAVCASAVVCVKR